MTSGKIRQKKTGIFYCFTLKCHKFSKDITLKTYLDIRRSTTRKELAYKQRNSLSELFASDYQILTAQHSLFHIGWGNLLILRKSSFIFSFLFSFPYHSAVTQVLLSGTCLQYFKPAIQRERSRLFLWANCLQNYFVLLLNCKDCSKSKHGGWPGFEPSDCIIAIIYVDIPWKVWLITHWGRSANKWEG